MFIIDDFIGKKIQVYRTDQKYLKDSSDGLLAICCRNSTPCPTAESVETDDDRCFEADDTPDDVEEPPP